MRVRKRSRGSRHRALRRYIARAAVALAVLLVVGGVWVVLRGVAARSELEATIPLAQQVEAELQTGNAKAANLTIATIGEHADSAASLTSDPVWKAYELIPIVGSNLRALDSVSSTMQNLAEQSRAPFSRIATELTAANLLPSKGTINVRPLETARPDIAAANTALQAASARADAIDTTFTIPQVDSGVKQFRTVLGQTASAMDAVRRAAIILPGMLGENGDRNYLLMFQNNAELRASGGIPGALALVHTSGGSMKLTTQTSASDFGEAKKPVLALPSEVTDLYSDRISTFMQDVTLSPDFPTTASLASAMWTKRYSQKIDGVLSFDPVGLSYLLRATGPLTLPNGDVLSSSNVVRTLLSGTYARYTDPKKQDAYFRTVASAAFSALSRGNYSPPLLLDAFTRASAERRVLVWSDRASEQSVIAHTTLAGVLQHDTAKLTNIGVYFNDATGSKMDYYLRSSVQQAQRVCGANGSGIYSETVTLRSTAPENAAHSLPAYVTGGGLFGVPAGKIKTRVVVYGPEDSVLSGVTRADRSYTSASGRDGTRPVVSFDVLLTPGAASTVTVDFRGSRPSAGALFTAVTPEVVPSTISTGTTTCGAGS